MTSVFHRTLRPILFLSKCIGLIDISYTMDSTGLLVHNVNSLFHIFFEITRLIVLLMFSYIYIYRHRSTILIIQVITLLKFWTNIIAARLSNNWIIEFINGMIEFDRKLALFSTSLLIKQRSFSEKQWDFFLISLFLYFIVFETLHFFTRPLKTDDILILINILFLPPFILDYFITSSLCYFLHNLHARFWTLNDLWKCLPAELVVDHDKWTHIEIVFFMEKTRLLHSELCELLKKFTIGFGPLLLAFFTFNFICLVVGIFFVVTSVHSLINEHSAAEVWDQIYNLTSHIQIFIFMMSIIVYVSFIEKQLKKIKKRTYKVWDQIYNLTFHIQIVIFMMSVIVYVSIIEEQRTKVISYLRLYRISNLHMDVKKQIKMFMNQMSVSGYDQITAFGFFNVNLNLVISILVLIITGITTLVQMKQHPIIIKLYNETVSYIAT